MARIFVSTLLLRKIRGKGCKITINCLRFEGVDNVTLLGKSFFFFFGIEKVTFLL